MFGAAASGVDELRGRSLNTACRLPCALRRRCSPSPEHKPQGDPAATIPKLVADTKAGLLVTDYSPLRLGRKWRNEVGAL
jgi:hypothetical protein